MAFILGLAECFGGTKCKLNAQGCCCIYGILFFVDQSYDLTFLRGGFQSRNGLANPE